MGFGNKDKANISFKLSVSKDALLYKGIVIYILFIIKLRKVSEGGWRCLYFFICFWPDLCYIFVSFSLHYLFVSLCYLYISFCYLYVFFPSSFIV